MTKNDGGCAFPVSLQGMFASGVFRATAFTDEGGKRVTISEMAYYTADAMLSERNK